MSRPATASEYAALLAAAMNRNDEKEVLRLSDCMVRDGVLLTATGLKQRTQTAIWVVLQRNNWQLPGTHRQQRIPRVAQG